MDPAYYEQVGERVHCKHPRPRNPTRLLRASGKFLGRRSIEWSGGERHSVSTQRRKAGQERKGFLDLLRVIACGLRESPGPALPAPRAATSTAHRAGCG